MLLQHHHVFHRIKGKACYDQHQFAVMILQYDCHEQPNHPGTPDRLRYR